MGIQGDFKCDIKGDENARIGNGRHRFYRQPVMPGA